MKDESDFNGVGGIAGDCGLRGLLGAGRVLDEDEDVNASLVLKREKPGIWSNDDSLCHPGLF